MKRIKIFDTTLRDGEQSPGCSMNLTEKIEMARQLEKLGVDVIEAGFAIASPMDHKSVQAIAAAVTNCTVASLARCAKGDIDAAWDAVKEANHPRIHVFLATSDIHMEPRREFGTVRFRIDGVLHNVYQVPASVMAAMTSRVKLLGRMDVVEKRRPQDGRIKTRTGDGKEIELRLATMPTAFGEKLVMRIFDPDVLLRDFTELGFGGEELAIWNDITTRPNGIVLVTGPTGSGKTTTLYSTLKQLATDEVNVCTVEDPIEMVEPAFNQMQVQGAIDLGFADGIRALMRQDPDIIMVGEIRDLETAQMAIQAALTGHLVLSTLHTNDSPSALTRLLDLGVPGYLLSATLNGIMAQRLVRTLCPACKQVSDEVPQAEWDLLIRPFRAPLPKRIYRPVGCLECRMTGFKGRAGLYELLVMDDALRGQFDETPDLKRLRAFAMRHGLRPLRLAGAMKIAAGITTFEEVLRTAPSMET